MINSTLQGLIAGWVMASIGLLNAFVPGITEVQQTALLGFGTVTVSLLLVVLNRFAPDTIDKDPAADYERARMKLARHVGVIAPSVDDLTNTATNARPSTGFGTGDGWPPPQDQGSRPPTPAPELAVDKSKDAS